MIDKDRERHICKYGKNIKKYWPEGIGGRGWMKVEKGMGKVGIYVIVSTIRNKHK